MGKIYEALEWHRKESRLKQGGEASRVFSIARFKPQKLRMKPAAAPHFADLKANFLSRYGNGDVKTIMVAGVESRDGASTCAVHFAGMLSRDSDYKVLLIDSNLRKPNFQRFFNTNNCYSLVNLHTNSGSNVHQFLPPRIEKGNLYVIPSGPKTFNNPAGFVQSNNFKRFLTDMRDKFDLTVIDAPPLRSHSDGIHMSAAVDGVILVVNAGVTQRWLASNMKKQIEEAGGRVLGVVLNKRKFYIPDWLYKRF